eukprot:12698-Heterococcus_DN1.PRE.1
MPTSSQRSLCASDKQPKIPIVAANTAKQQSQIAVRTTLEVLTLSSRPTHCCGIQGGEVSKRASKKPLGKDLVTSPSRYFHCIHF